MLPGFTAEASLREGVTTNFGYTRYRSEDANIKPQLISDDCFWDCFLGGQDWDFCFWACDYL